MALTFHGIGADAIPRTQAHALLHAEDLILLRRRPGSRRRVDMERACDRLHERLTVQGIAHVCQITPATGMITQIWVMEPTEISP